MYEKNVSEKDWKRQVEMWNKNDLDFFHFEELLKYEKMMLNVMFTTSTTWLSYMYIDR